MSSQNQVAFNEDQAELEAHFTERVQAYLELGETPEEALLSAQEKFGETERVLSELRWQRLRRSPILWGLICAGGYLLLVTFVKAPWTYGIFFGPYLLYVWQTTTKKQRVSR
ncbi:permease prefix domain 1-containing protein [Armatimonas sp.]|uniref:permease prefix domain 1-containing protein n=1 Tax=Armatimonas sp. TaxID=1872638 RepID=UPI00374DA8FE